ncbi:MAG: hypothetical protein GC149_11380 [Gammaproteobacteria bacterium]|nr:hypothetical protein [Gammaproteobacteria bacterium]
MNYSLRYSSIRSEVWHWYWKAWKSRLWWHHVSIAVFFCAGYVGIGLKNTDPVIWGEYFILALIAITAIFSSIPQILFKSKERKLNVGPNGWDTQIGKKNGARNWNEVATIQNDSGKVIITSKNGNALIIPERAFIDTEDRERFLKDIKGWHASYNSAKN